MTSPAPTAEAAVAGAPALGVADQVHKSPSKIIARFAQVFPEQPELSSLWTEWGLSFFAFANLMIFRLLMEFRYFSSVASRLEPSFAVVFAVLSIPIAAYCLYGMLRRINENIERRYLTPELCNLLAIGLMTMLAFHSVLFDRETLYRLSWDQNLIIVLFLLTSARLVHSYLFMPLRAAAGFEISEVAPTGRRVEEQQADAAALSTQIVPSSQIKANDMVQVLTGEMIPVDGVIVDGSAQIAEVRLSGRSEFKHKLQGDQVFAGSRVVSGKLIVRAAGPQFESHITTFSSVLNDRIAQTLAQRFERHNFAVTLAVIVTLSAALCAALVWVARDASFAQATSVFAALALSTTVCQLIALMILLRPISESSAFRLGALAVKNYLVDEVGAVKTLILDYRPGGVNWQGEVSRIELIDRRIDENSLLGAVFALSDRAHSPKFNSISRYLRARYPRLQLLAVKDFHEFAAGGLFATIEGYELSLGDENFLLERGVMMQPSELGGVSAEEEVLYVALNEEIIARVVLQPKLSSAAKTAVAQLKALGIRTVLCSMEPGEDLDSLGKRMGLELSDVLGGLNRDTYIRKLETLNPAALMMNDHTDAEVARRAETSLSVFDELHWDTKRSEILLFTHAPAALAQVFAAAKSYKQVETQNLIFGAGLSLVLLVLGSLGYITPAISCAAVFTAGLAMLLNSYRLVASTLSA